MFNLGKFIPENEVEGPTILIPNTAVFGSTNLLTTTTARRRMTPGRGWLKKDFYGGRTGPLEKFYLFIYLFFIYFIQFLINFYLIFN